MNVSDRSIQADIGTDNPEEMIVRSFSAELTPGDGRTVDVRIVPYGERITHNDGLGGVPKGVPYTEEWISGAFSHQVNAANRVLMNFEHQQGIAGIIGHGVALIERHDGLYGSFKLHQNADGDKALMLIQEGALQGVSVEAVGKKSIRGRDGVIRRVKAHLHGIALTRKGAYPGSVVLALRDGPQPMWDEEILPVPIDHELIARCERLGVEVPESLKAHPVEDTPAKSGTSEDGTRQAKSTQSSEVPAQ